MTRLSKYIRELDYCTYCPKLCSFTCPVSSAENSESVTPWAKMTLANLIRKGYVDLTVETSEPFQHCLGCRLCTMFCKHEIEVGEVLTAARADCIEAGIMNDGLETLKTNMLEYGNAYGIDANEKLMNILDKTLFVENAQAVFFPGIEAINTCPEEIIDAFSVFDKLNIDFISCHSGPIHDAGLSLYRAGFTKEFADHARRLAHNLMDYKLIVTTSAETAYTLKAIYLEHGFKLGRKVKHLLEFLEPYLKNTDFDNKEDAQVTYHDPCYLGRFLGNTNYPRELLAKITVEKPVEMVWNGSSSYCCGNTGSYPFINKEKSCEIARERISHAEDVNAEMLVTACSSCTEAFTQANSDSDVKITSIISMIDKCLK